METLPDGTKRSRRQIKGPIKFIPQEMSPEPKKHQVRGTVCIDTLETSNVIIRKIEQKLLQLKIMKSLHAHLVLHYN